MNMRDNKENRNEMAQNSQLYTHEIISESIYR